MESIRLAIFSNNDEVIQTAKMKVLKEFMFDICIDWYWFDVHGEVTL